MYPMYLSAGADPLDPSGNTSLFGEYSNPGDPNTYPTDRGLFFWKGENPLPNPINLNPYGSLP